MADELMDLRFEDLDRIEVRKFIDGVQKIALSQFRVESVVITISVTPSAVIKFIPK